MKIKTVFGLILVILLLAACKVMPKVAEMQNSEPQTGELQPEPTESVLSEDLILRDEFDDDINNHWGMKIVSGLEEQLIWSQSNGKFRLEIQPPNDTNYAFFRKDTSYKDVTVQAEVENYGQLDNAFSLMCRATEAGWYELRISSQGYYELLRFDQYLADEGKNAYTNFVESRIGSTLIKSGQEVNVFALSCEGNQLKVFINGEQVYKDKRPLTIEDNTYTEGSIGFGVLSYGKEVDVTFNYIETLKP
ncbi:MAG: hypothetical protein C4545_05760 [Anaerolineaceae bacterium]|jgi:hypothetical protein|nr:MAG: hypothetical protein C4545_05760 [Anaerolineaceae bacterium]